MREGMNIRPTVDPTSTSYAVSEIINVQNAYNNVLVNHMLDMGHPQAARG